MPIGHECGLAASTGHHAFLDIFQEVLFTGDTILFGLIVDQYLFLVGNAT